MIADACAILAFFGAGAKTMSEAGIAAMRGDVSVSPITVWEIAHKAAAGKLPPLPVVRGSFANYLSATGLRAEPLVWEDAERASKLPPHHKDPMDRMLIATALRTGQTIITADGIFGAYGVGTIW